MAKHSTKRRRIGSVCATSSGKWCARVTVGTKVNGRRKVVSRTFADKQDAESWIIARKAESGERPDIGHDATLRMVWPAYQSGKSLTNKSMYTYKWHIDTTWMPAIGDVPLSELSPSVVQDVLSSMTHENAKHAKTALSSVLTYAKHNGWIPENPLHGHRFDYPKKQMDGFDSDPFGAIEQTRDVWGVETVLRCMPLIRGLPLEPAWLCCVGAGLRVEEALALRRMDVRRVAVSTREEVTIASDGTEFVRHVPVMVTQLAIHAARTPADGLKVTKTTQSTRIVGMIDAMGVRLWDIVRGIEDKNALICPLSANSQNRHWRNYFRNPLDACSADADERMRAKHVGVDPETMQRGRLSSLPYLPLSKMRNTHVTLMSEVGVSDSINALMHGHTEMVERRHYLSPDTMGATIQASEHLRLVV